MRGRRKSLQNCQSKEGFNSIGAVNAAIEAISARKGYQPGYLEFYRCPHCHQFHITHKRGWWPFGRSIST